MLQLLHTLLTTTTPTRREVLRASAASATGPRVLDFEGAFKSFGSFLTRLLNHTKAAPFTIISELGQRNLEKAQGAVGLEGHPYNWLDDGLIDEGNWDFPASMVITYETCGRIIEDERLSDRGDIGEQLFSGGFGDRIMIEIGKLRTRGLRGFDDKKINQVADFWVRTLLKILPKANTRKNKERRTGKREGAQVKNFEPSVFDYQYLVRGVTIGGTEMTSLGPPIEFDYGIYSKG